MFTIGNPEVFYTLFALVGIVICYFFYQKWRKRAAIKFGEMNLIRFLNPDFSSRMPNIRFLLFSIALFFLIIGLSNPQYGSKAIEVTKKGIDLVVALDLSNSMLTEDIKPHRLSRAKNAIYKLLEKLRGDRIALVVFAGEAYTQLPLTTDYSAAKLFLNSIDPSIIPVQGTSLSLAMKRSVKSFGEFDFKSDKRSRAVILITDGEDHEAGIEASLQSIVEKNIFVHVVGVATESGGPVPEYKNGIKVGYKKNKEGNIVRSSLNQNLMREIASNGKGLYINASSGNLGLNEIYNHINSLEKVELGTKSISDYISRYQWFLTISFLFLFVEGMLLDKKQKWLSKFKIFRNNAISE